MHRKLWSSSPVRGARAVSLVHSRSSTPGFPTGSSPSPVGRRAGALAGLELERGVSAKPGATSAEADGVARGRAEAVADRFGIVRIDRHVLEAWLEEQGRRRPYGLD